MVHDFDVMFRQLTDQNPMSWQTRLYEKHFLNGELPAVIDIPTGLGKTAVVAIWLVALGKLRSKLPRRLVYVVNRRTVVDQTTTEVEKYRTKLLEADSPALVELADSLRALRGVDAESGEDPPLAISTLRGQFADNREWSANPCRPAVIIGTVDMIGSRLLFNGYGVGFKAKPLHAGFLGQDVLLVHDEAHLEPAFQELLIAIQKEQQRCREFGKFQVIELSATSRHKGETFGLSPEDYENEIVRQRIYAKKSVCLHENNDAKKLGVEIGALAVKLHNESKQAVLIFARTIEDVEKAAKKLPRGSFEKLTGTMRGLERDKLVRSAIFQRFLAPSNRDQENRPAEGTVYLVCTSAGEVGVNISADHLVCDLSTFESMAQRLGRVNRFGEPADHVARVDVVYPKEFDENNELEVRRMRTLALLRQLNGDGSPAALGELDSAIRLDAFAPQPTIPSTTDMLFDAWALTTIREQLPGRPPVEDFLHGIREWEPPETHIAWREEVGVITGELLDRYPPEDLLEDFPLKPHELLRDRSERVFDQLQLLASKHPEEPVWIVDDRGNVLRNPRTGQPWLLADLADPSATKAAVKKALIAWIEGRTLFLPPEVGGLNHGMLDGESDIANDVADIDEPASERRLRIWSSTKAVRAKTEGMRLIRSIEPGLDDDDNDERPTWEWFKYRPVEDARTAKSAVLWDIHVKDVTRHSGHIVEGLSLPPELAQAIRVAAKLHDHGKRRAQFQFTLGNRAYPELILAKSAGTAARLREPYRHEFGSLADAAYDAEFQQLSPDMQDVVLHLIASHHGRARPHFPRDEVYDPERSESDSTRRASEAARRFARLQRKYGRWGLAYLESLLRAADWAASSEPSEYAIGT